MSGMSLAQSAIVVGWLLGMATERVAEDTVLFSFEEPASAKDWLPATMRWSQLPNG
jgi:hypothetical protein